MIPIFILHPKPMDEILPPKPLGELTGELKNLTSSLDLSYEDLLHIERLLQTQLGCAYSLSEYEKTHQPNRYKKTKRILEFIDKNFNYNRTDRGYTDIHNSLREYRAFLFQKKHEMDVREALHIQQEDFTIKLGRRKESLGGTIQNIQVYYKGQLIIDGDDPSQTLHIIINYENAPKRISTNDENDTRYIQKNQAYV